MPGRAEIGPYHRGVASDAQAILGRRVTFYPSDEEKWYNCRAETDVKFDLIPTDLTRLESAWRTRSEDGPAHRVYVFPLSVPSSSHLARIFHRVSVFLYRQMA